MRQLIQEEFAASLTPAMLRAWAELKGAPEPSDEVVVTPARTVEVGEAYPEKLSEAMYAHVQQVRARYDTDTAAARALGVSRCTLWRFKNDRKVMRIENQQEAGRKREAAKRALGQ